MMSVQLARETPFNQYTVADIESELLTIFMINNGIEPARVQNQFLRSCLRTPQLDLRAELLERNQDWSIKGLETVFYSLVDDETRTSNGVVFTPDYIVDYILSETMDQFELPTICDLSCGCGAFLIPAAQRLKERNPSLTMVRIVENRIFGIDISRDHVRRTRILLTLLCELCGEDPAVIRVNIVQGDSLNPNVLTLFDPYHPVHGFDCVVGNPPYVKIQDLSVAVRQALTEHFTTASFGMFNMYYAFLELGMKLLRDSGKLGYIVPNYFLKMKSAQPLRDFLLDNRFMSKVLDFRDNMLFDNAQTYSSIVIMDKASKDSFDYCTIPALTSRDLSFANNTMRSMRYADVDSESINLLDETQLSNINKIETIGFKLKISTGIATQKDNLYILGLDQEDLVDETQDFFVKVHNGERYPIEKAITRNLIKGGSNITPSGELKKQLKVIYPYQRVFGKTVPIPEDVMSDRFPAVYRYFKCIEGELAKRNGGLPQVKFFYEYGRSQALDSFGPKIISPTNSNKPKFILFEDNALFNNGYAIFPPDPRMFEHDPMPMMVLNKILNSVVMDYYIKSTSYMISGGYYCYQKKFIEKFSVPYLTSEEISYLSGEQTPFEIGEFLIDKYELSIDGIICF